MISSVVKPPLKAVFYAFFQPSPSFRHSVSYYEEGIAALQTTGITETLRLYLTVGETFYILKFSAFISHSFRSGNQIRTFAGAGMLPRACATASFSIQRRGE